MENYNIKRRDFFSIGPHFLGLIFFAVGIFTMASPLLIKSENSTEKALLVGSAALLFGLAVIFSYGGTLFDFKERRFKSYYSLCGFKFGQWQNLADLKLIKVTSTSFRTTSSSNGVNPSMSGNGTSYKALLYSKSPQPILVVEHSIKDRILKDAKIISDNLNTALEIRLAEIN